MPIQLMCPTCGKKLQVGDQYAGRKVACPGCKTVITAPGAPAAPAAAAPPPAPKSAPPAPKPAAPPPAAPKLTIPRSPPPPPPAAPPEPEPVEDEPAFSFDSGSKSADEENADDRPKPPGKKGTGIVGAPASTRSPSRPAARRRDDDDRPPRGRARPRAGAEEENWSASAWSNFGSGSALAKWGMWIEFLSLAYGIGITAKTVTGFLGNEAQQVETARKINDAGGPAMFVPVFVGAAIGSLLMLIGRTRMLGIPPGTGAKKVFFGAWAFTLVRFIAVAAAAGFCAMAATEWPDLTTAEGRADKKVDDAAKHLFIAFLAFGASTPFWLLADLSSIPAMAIIGGAIPNLRLRQKAGQVTFVFQALVLAYIVAIILAATGLSQVDWKAGPRDATEVSAPTGRPGTRTQTSGTSPTSGGSTTEGAKAAIMLSAGLGILVQLAYTALFASMYGAGRRAVAEAHEAERKPVDEDE